MPKIVDHDSRREEIAEAVWRLIARDGIAAATTRSIAKEAGCSNGVLHHYFADKAELLHAAMLLGYRRVEEEVRECLGRSSGLEALREVMGLSAALTDYKLLANKVELAYRGEAVGNPRIAKQHFATYQMYRDIIRDLLVDARRTGDLASTIDVETVADMLVALIDGLGMEAALFPDDFSAERQAAIIDGFLAALGGNRRRATGKASLRRAAKHVVRGKRRSRSGSASR